jgi:riboflavin kinase / FMN adenylyltransferase
MASAEENPRPGTVVTPGNHDGVHLGHRALVDEARRVADESPPPLRVVALTFDPHPLQFVAPERAPALLTTVERRAELLRDAGADEVVVQRFDRAFSELSPEAFVDRILVGELRARAVVVGADFRFGAQRAGDVAMLDRLAAERGMGVTIVQPVTLDGVTVSSSEVRAAVSRGEVEQAARMLTRVHELTRGVLHGAKRGRTIGFPTANLELTGLLAPADGVYAVAVRILDDDASQPSFSSVRHFGVANLGVRPTVAGGRSLEVHLLDFEGDLYERSVRVGFVARLRGETKFPDLAALRAQIARDVEAGRRVLAACDPRLLRWI